MDTVFYRIIRAVAIGTHSDGSYSILVCADCRSQEFAIGEIFETADNNLMMRILITQTYQ